MLTLFSWALLVYITAAGIYTAHEMPPFRNTAVTTEADWPNAEPKDTLPNVETCATEIVYCTQDFKPTSCSVSTNGQVFSSQGANLCETLFNLKRVLCQANISVVPKKVWNTRKCQSQD